MKRRFRFSLSLGGTTGPEDFIELCRKAESLGYDTVSMADHLEQPYEYAPLIALTGAAAATSTLRLLSLVLANDYRHPAVLAKEATTLDQLSGGRLELGIGAGWMRSDYQQAGMVYDRAGVRIERLAEAVQILKAAFGGEPVNFAGKHYNIDQLINTPKPAQESGIPIMIAGGGPKILTLAAREAHIIGLNPGLAAGVIDERVGASATSSATDQKIAWIKDAAGARFDDIELQTRVHLAAITDERSSLAEAIGPALGLSGEDALASPHMLVGSQAQCIETLERWRENWGISYIGLSADAVHQMAPVVAALS